MERNKRKESRAQLQTSGWVDTREHGSAHVSVRSARAAENGHNSMR